MAISHGLLGQIIVNNEGVFTAIAVVLAHGASSKGRQVLHGGRVRGIGRDHNRVRHGAMLFELADNRRHRGGFLAHCDVNAFNTGAFLVNDGINRNSGFPNLAIANNQLSLAASDWHHGINSLKPYLNRLIDRLTGNNPRGDFLNRVGHLGLNGSLPVNGVA